MYRKRGRQSSTTIPPKPAFSGALAAYRARAGTALTLGLLLASGCASTPQSLEAATARALGTVTPADVTVSATRFSGTAIRWIAVTPKGRYVCVSRDHLRHTRCVKRFSGPAPQPYGKPNSPAGRGHRAA